MENQIKNILKQYNIPINDNQVQKISNFVSMMKEYNKTHNITAITDDIEILYKHILDSLLPYQKIQDICDSIYKSSHTDAKILDIGCGGGFPSVPLAIVLNNAEITALDSVHKKTAFVELVKKAENLNNLNILTDRIENIASKQNYREQFDIVTSRAVAPLNIILEYSAPMLKNGGFIIAYKGSNYLEEIENAKNALNILDCKIDKIIEYKVSEIDANRYILQIIKKSKISTKYPRKQNKPRLQPL